MTLLRSLSQQITMAVVAACCLALIPLYVGALVFSVGWMVWGQR